MIPTATRQAPRLRLPIQDILALVAGYGMAALFSRLLADTPAVGRRRAARTRSLPLAGIGDEWADRLVAPRTTAKPRAGAAARSNSRRHAEPGPSWPGF